jgi:phenol 2-monooxygenase
MPATLEFQSTIDEPLEDVSFTRSQPLPRLSPTPTTTSTGVKKFEVVVIGVGPAGLMLTTLLTRYGLPATSVLCVDKRDHQTLVGNADGINPRTLEILGTLGLEDQLRKEGMPFVDLCQWHRSHESQDQLTRLFKVPFFLAPARYEQLITIHQGRVESILRQDIVKHGGSDTMYKTRLINVSIDKEDVDYPVTAVLEHSDGTKETIRSKFLAGADGAKSTVRDVLGMETEGDRTDELWGVVDFVPDSDFPDIRRHCNINGSVGTDSMLHLKRGRLADSQRETIKWRVSDTHLYGSCGRGARTRRCDQQGFYNTTTSKD